MESLNSTLPHIRIFTINQDYFLKPFMDSLNSTLPHIKIFTNKSGLFP